MKNDQALVETIQFKNAFNKWESILKLGENICVIFPYLSDRQSRVYQLSQLLDKSLYYPISINLSMYSLDDAEEFEAHIISLLPQEWQATSLHACLEKINKRIVLIVADGETLVDLRNYKVMSFIQNILTSHMGEICSFIAFEQDIYQKIPSMYSYNKLFQNVFYYPLYDSSDTNLFVRYLCAKWKMKMPSPIRKSIVFACGGSFWLTKEACRNYRDTNVWNTTSEGFYHRLTLLGQVFSEKEVIVLNSLPYIKSLEKSQEYKHLKKIGIVTEDNKLRIPLLLPILKSRIRPENLVEIKDGEIFLKGVSLTQVLSPTEFSVLKLFLSEPNTPISRDKIANVIWPNNTEEHYSSWAIDQTIKRLRDRLVSLRLPPTIISSVRGVGYEYRN